MSEALAGLRSRASQQYRLDDWRTTTPALESIVAQARLAATTACPVAIVGESGTGKCWLARAVHHASERRHLPFVALDCGYLPGPAVRGVLFGPLGLEHPDWLGTLYLRDPGGLPRELQSELAGRFADQPDAGVRIIAGFVSDPAEDVRAGRLLEELFAALSVLTIRLPPLRERPADLPLLTETMLSRGATTLGRPPATLTPEAAECLRAHLWPGNLRELHALLLQATERATAGRIDVAHLPLSLRQARLAAEAPPRPIRDEQPLDKLLEQVERRLIELALKRSGGNQSKAAEMLGVWRPRLIRRIKALGIDAG